MDNERTCTEGTPKFHATVHDSENNVFRKPILVAIKLVVPKGEELHLEAGKHQLGAIEGGVC